MYVSAIVLTVSWKRAELTWEKVQRFNRKPKKIERFSIHIYCQNWIFSVHSPSPATVGAQNLTPQPPPPPAQKLTRLWLAKIHSRVSWNITPLSISHYGVGGGRRGFKLVGMGEVNRKDLWNFIWKKNFEQILLAKLSLVSNIWSVCLEDLKIQKTRKHCVKNFSRLYSYFSRWTKLDIIKTRRHPNYKAFQ